MSGAQTSPAPAAPPPTAAVAAPAPLAGTHTLALVLLLALASCLVPALAALRPRLAENAAVYLEGRSLAALTLDACLLFALLAAPAIGAHAAPPAGRAALAAAALHALLMALVLVPFLALAGRMHPPAGLGAQRLAALLALFALAAFNALAWRALLGRWYAAAVALLAGLPLFLVYLAKAVLDADASGLAVASPLGAMHMAAASEGAAAWSAWAVGLAVLGVSAIAALALGAREKEKPAAGAGAG